MQMRCRSCFDVQRSKDWCEGEDIIFPADSLILKNHVLPQLHLPFKVHERRETASYGSQSEMMNRVNNIEVVIMRFIHRNLVLTRCGVLDLPPPASIIPCLC